MNSSRREAMGLALAGGLLGTAAPAALAKSVVTASARGPWAAGIEGQRRADLGNGRYLNPVLAGDHPDPAVLKDGDDYYATFSSFEYYPGMLIWHSRDLVNWTPLAPALTKMIGSIYAVDIVKHGGRYFIYMPVFLPRPVTPPPPGGRRRAIAIYVIHAESMAGPWSEPIDMGIDNLIDPSHVVGEDGKRYLFLSDGHLVPISDDGLKAAGPSEEVYGGWTYPQEWIVESRSLEGPWIIRKGEWFYMFSAQGGTAGPPTSHMIVVARSRSVRGPWENSPHNPVVHTFSRNEPWWSRGHPAVVQGPKGDWWLLYHGYENGFRTLGRQCLLEPMNWTRDGWPRALGGDLSNPLPKPRNVPGAAHGLALSGPFAAADLGRKMAFHKPAPDYLDRVRFESGALILKGQGKDPSDASPLAFNVGDRSYTMSVEIEVRGGAFGGLFLFYNEALFSGVDRDSNRRRLFRAGKASMSLDTGEALGTRFHLKVVNDENVASFFWSRDGQSWTREVSYEVAGLNHNVGGGFVSLRPALVASGAGEVVFRSLRYQAGTTG